MLSRFTAAARVIVIGLAAIAPLGCNQQPSGAPQSSRSSPPLPSNDAGAKATSGVQKPEPAPSATTEPFPPLGDPTAIAPDVQLYSVTLRRNNVPMKVWVYLPASTQGKVPCVLVAPAGSSLFAGMHLAEDDRAEHLPYVKAGFAVVAYEIDGPIRNPDKASDAQIIAAAKAYKNSQAGLANAKMALDFAIDKIPSLDTDRIYTAGHSSAGTLALLVASHDQRIKGCAAFAPVTDVPKRIAAPVRLIGKEIPGFPTFIRDHSPHARINQLKCPVFLFHATDDSNIPIKETSIFATTLKKTNSQVTYATVPRGDHYDSMIKQGIPQAVEWLKGLAGLPAPTSEIKKGVEPASPGLPPLERPDASQLTAGERAELPAEAVALLRGNSGKITSSCFTPDGTRLFTGTDNSSISLWDLKANQPVERPLPRVEGATGPVQNLVISSDGKWLVSMHRDPKIVVQNVLQLWELTADGAKQKMSKKSVRNEFVAFHPNNTALATANHLNYGNIGARLFEMNASGWGNQLCEIPGQLGHLKFSPDGKSIAAIYFSPEFNGSDQFGSEIKIWDVTGAAPVELQHIQIDQMFRSIVYGPNGKWLATGSNDRHVRIWDMTVKPPATNALFTMGERSKSLRFTPDGNYLVAFGEMNEIALWNVSTKVIEKSWKIGIKNKGAITPTNPGILTATSMAPDGRHIAFSRSIASIVILRLPIPAR